mgnify:CR=1 FL=1
MTNIRIYPDKTELVQSLTEQILTIESESIKEEGRFSIALSGGSTPKALYQHLAESDAFQWDKWYIFFGDERTVPPDDDDSNYRMAKETFLSKVPIPENQVYRMKGELEPTVSAEAYERVLQDVFGDNGFPQLNLILLGMGDDGHTASLFPHTAPIHETEKWVIAHYVEKLDTWRITLTPPVLNNAHYVAFMVTGDKKADRLNQVIHGDYQPDTLPSQIIKPEHGQLLWYVDQAAASHLE